MADSNGIQDEYGFRRVVPRLVNQLADIALKKRIIEIFGYPRVLSNDLLAHLVISYFIRSNFQDQDHFSGFHWVLRCLLAAIFLHLYLL